MTCDGESLLWVLSPLPPYLTEQHFPIQHTAQTGPETFLLFPPFCVRESVRMPLFPSLSRSPPSRGLSAFHTMASTGEGLKLSHSRGLTMARILPNTTTIFFKFLPNTYGKRLAARFHKVFLVTWWISLQLPLSFPHISIFYTIGNTPPGRTIPTEIGLVVYGGDRYGTQKGVHYRTAAAASSVPE